MAINWEENLRLGDPVIDEQHESIFAQFAMLSKAVTNGSCEEEVEKILAYLKAYTTTHFSDEEDLMTRHAYAGLEEQLQQHVQFKENIASLQEMLAKNVPTKEVAIKIEAALIRYTINHVRNIDSKLVDFIKDKAG